MKTLLKRKGFWQYTEIEIPNPTNDHAKFIVDGKKDEVVGIIAIYILWEIHYHLIGIECPHQV